MEVVEKLSAIVAQSQQDLKRTKSPLDIYNDKVADVKAKIDNVWATLQTDRISLDEKHRLELQDKIVSFGGYLKELQMDFEATRADAEHVYEEYQKDALQALSDKLVAALGLQTIEASMKHLSLNNTSTDGFPGEVSGHNEMSRHRPQEAAEEGGIVHVYISDSGEEEEEQHRSSPKKRSRDDAETLNSAEPRKRLLVDDRPSLDFEDVWQAGKAPVKHIITEYPDGSDTWYILRCEKHDMNFRENPIMGAAKHLSGSKHGHMPRSHAMAIEHLGILVTKCTKDKADKNNTAARDSFRNGGISNPSKMMDYPEKTSEPSRRPMLRRHRGGCAENSSTMNDNQDDLSMSAGIVDPTPGEIYLGFWPKSKEWLPVLLLFTNDSNLDIGVPGTIEELGLMNNIPSCYVYDKRTKKLQWRKDYEDSNSMVMKREFPVMYFDGLPFPERSAVGWVAATNLQIFDPEKASSLISNIRQVRDFLQKRQKRQKQSVCDLSSHGAIQPEEASGGMNNNIQQATGSRIFSESRPATTEISKENYMGLAGKSSHRKKVTQDETENLPTHEPISRHTGSSNMANKETLTPNDVGETPCLPSPVIDIASHSSQDEQIVGDPSSTAQISEAIPSTYLDESTPTPQRNRTWDQYINDVETIDEHFTQHTNAEMVSSNDMNARDLGIYSHSIGNSNVQQPFDPPQSHTVQDHGRPSQPPTHTMWQDTSFPSSDEGHLQNDQSSHVDESSPQSRNHLLRSLACASLSHTQEELPDDSNAISQVTPALSDTKETKIITSSFNTWSPPNIGSNGSRSQSEHQNRETETPHSPAGTYGQTFGIQESSTWVNKEPLRRLPPPSFITGAFELHPHYPCEEHSGNIGANHLLQGFSTSYQDSSSRVRRPDGHTSFEPMQNTPEFIRNGPHPRAYPNTQPFANNPLNRFNFDETQPTQSKSFPVFTIPVKLWEMIDSNKNRYPDAPGSNCFRNSQGAFICPLCPRGMEYSTAVSFKEHLDTHTT